MVSLTITGHDLSSRDTACPVARTRFVSPRTTCQDDNPASATGKVQNKTRANSPSPPWIASCPGRDRPSSRRETRRHRPSRDDGTADEACHPSTRTRSREDYSGQPGRQRRPTFW